MLLRRPVCLPLVILLGSCIGLKLGAQTPVAEGQPTTLTVNARLVVLDVVVTDASGKPVDNLTAKDFEVYEDGKLQHLRSVEKPSSHDLPQSTIDAGTAAVFDPGKPASFGRSPVTVLVLDQLNTHFEDSSFARRSLHDYLVNQPALLNQPTTLLSVYDSHFKLLNPFTRDRDALLHALAAAPPEYAWKLEVNGKTDTGPLERLDQSLRALEEVAQSYARIAGRKNVIWVGGGFPTVDPAAMDSEDADLVKAALQHVTDVLLDTRVTLYAVDPTSNAPGMTEITDPTQMVFFLATGDNGGGNMDPFDQQEDFNRLGPLTGGRVIRGLNNVDQQIATSIELGANFYTLAYTPSVGGDASAQFRKIKVVCLRPGLTATSRSGYYPAGTQQQGIANATYDLATAAESAMPLHGLRVTVERDRDPAAPADTYKVRVGAAELTWKPKNGEPAASVYVMAASLDAKGRMVDHTIHGMTANAKPSADLHDPEKTATFVFTAGTGRKATTLRFIVRDSGNGRMGTFDLTVKP